MGGNIHLTICGGVLKAENANCERRVKPTNYIFHIGTLDIPWTQHRAGIMLVNEEAKCRQ